MAHRKHRALHRARSKLVVRRDGREAHRRGEVRGDAAASRGDGAEGVERRRELLEACASRAPLLVLEQEIEELHLTKVEGGVVVGRVANEVERIVERSCGAASAIASIYASM